MIRQGKTEQGIIENEVFDVLKTGKTGMEYSNAFYGFCREDINDIYSEIYGQKVEVKNVGNSSHFNESEKFILDGVLAIDTVIEVEEEIWIGPGSCYMFKEKFTHTVQERISTKNRNKISIRLYNDDGERSEFFKLHAGHYLFIFVNKYKKEVERYVWIPDAKKVITLVKDGKLENMYDSYSYSHSQYITINIDDLKDLKDELPGIIDWKKTDLLH